MLNDWTHTQLRILDIRKINKLYAIKIDHIDIQQPLFVKDSIFEERLRSYFLKESSKISREDILNVYWNMYLSKGYYIKINHNGVIEKYDYDPEKWYVSYMEIDGHLGSFSIVCKEERERKQLLNNLK